MKLDRARNAEGARRKVGTSGGLTLPRHTVAGRGDNWLVSFEKGATTWKGPQGTAARSLCASQNGLIIRERRLTR